MKIVSDFDGVLTDQTEEAERMLEIFCEELSTLTEQSEQNIKVLVNGALRELQKNPHQNGWFSKNLLTAFTNEDYFIRNNAIGSRLDFWVADGHQELKNLKTKISSHGFSDFIQLMQWAYEEMVNETQKGKFKPIDNVATGVLRRLLSWGAEVTVVSNSGTQRIVDLLLNAGLDAHDALEEPEAKLKVRGGAAKYELGTNPENFKIGNYTIQTDRPSYLKILMEEKPQVVIGDVFSLDLALPLQLGGIKLILRTRPYTPTWVLDYFEKNKSQNPNLLLLNDWAKIPTLLGIKN